MSRRSFRKLSRGGEVESQKAWGSITSLALRPHAVFTSYKGGKILAREGLMPP